MRRRARATAGVTAAALATTIAALAPPANAAMRERPRVVQVKTTTLPAPAAPGTPETFKASGIGKVDLNKVGIVKVSARHEEAKNVLVLEPGTSAAAAYFVPLAKSLVEGTRGWQVWAVERRQSFLQAEGEFTKYKFGKLTPVENPSTHEVESPSEQLYDYYLGYIGHPEVTKHYLPIFDGNVQFAKQWGMNVAVEDLKVVIEQAKALGGKVVLGGHSLGGTVVTAYATWDFGGKAGADGLSGLVYDDGGSSPTPITRAKAEEELAKLEKPETTPWLAFGGIPAPDLGLFSDLGSTLTLIDGEGPAQLEKFLFLPSNLKPPESEQPPTNEAGFGYGVNVGSSPANLAAAQVHAGAGVEETAKEDGLHGWNGSGALTPLRRYAEMLAGAGLHKQSGSEWYFPARLTLDTGAVAEGNANEAQEVLGLHATKGHELPSSLKILAIDSELDKDVALSSLSDAETLAEQSGIPRANLTLIDEGESYAHNDPAGATPADNAFYTHLVPYLEAIAAE
jgi:pimeloyl-ACP methyl ester carboxylesterase